MSCACLFVRPGERPQAMVAAFGVLCRSRVVVGAWRWWF